MYFVFVCKGTTSVPSKAMTDHCQKKVTHLEHYISIPEDTRVEVVLKVHPNDQKVEIDIPIDASTHLHAEATHDDYYAAVNIAVKKLEDQIRTLKTKKLKITYLEAPENEMEYPETTFGEIAITSMFVPKDIDKCPTTFHIDYLEDDGETSDITFVIDTSGDMWQQDLIDTWENYRTIHNLDKEIVVDAWSNYILEE